MLKKMNKAAWALTIVLLAGCASGIKGTDYEIPATATSSRPGFGVVFGRICGGNGLRFRSVTNGPQEVLHIGGKTAFVLQLPEGTYQLYQIGSPTGDMVADRPLQFKVRNGGVHYIGSLLPRWTNAGVDRFQGACGKEESQIVKTVAWSNKGLLATSKAVWQIDIANYLQGAVNDVKRVFPRLDMSQAEVSIVE